MPAHRLAPLERMRTGQGERPQNLALLVAQLPRFAVDHAQGAHAAAVAQAHRCAGIEADVGLAGNERVVGKARVVQGIGHFENLVAQHCVRAESHVTRCFAHPRQADVGLEPLALFIDKADQRDGRTAHQRSGEHQGIELGFGTCIQYLQRAQRREAGQFIVTGGCSLHPEIP